LVKDLLDNVPGSISKERYDEIKALFDEFEKNAI